MIKRIQGFEDSSGKLRPKECFYCNVLIAFHLSPWPLESLTTFMDWIRA